jgi:hypothetical protein
MMISVVFKKNKIALDSMKKLIIAIVIGITYSSVDAQNIQTHYDFGDDRQMVTTTVEMFKPDDYGSFFFFIDFDYGGKAADVEGVSLSYFEIARNLKFWDSPFEIHAEYNSGMFRTSTFSASINSAYLLGGSYTLHNSDFSQVLTLLSMYKYITKKHSNSFQVTAIWEIKLLDDKISFAGFSDFWREDNIVYDEEGNSTKTDFVFITEPQLWYHLNNHLSLGSEVEISNNFATHKGIMINPTLALKWTF